jgi:Ser/Thr protein kinase RdoA (MazF antagonist)
MRKVGSLHSARSILRAAVPGHTDEIIVTDLVASSRRTAVFRGESALYPCPVSVKFCLGSQDGLSVAEDAVQHFEFMSQLQAITARDPRLNSPRVFGLFAEFGIVISEWVPGQSLKQELRQASPMQTLDAVRTAGVWLARFVAAAGYSMRPLSTALMVSGWPELSATCQARRSVELLLKTVEQVEGREVRWTRCFGDFKPDNLIVSAEGLYGIDCQLSDSGPEILDAAHFLNHVALIQMLRGCGRHAAATSAGLDAAFCEGYRSVARTGFPELQLLWVRLHHAVRFWRRYMTRPWWPPDFASALMVRHLMAVLHRRLAIAAAS